MGYKVGDIVRIVSNTHGHEFAIGDIVRVSRVDEFYDEVEACEYLDGHDYWCLGEEDIEPVVYEIGDIVRCIDTTYDNVEGLTVDSCYRILGIDNDGTSELYTVKECDEFGVVIDSAKLIYTINRFVPLDPPKSCPFKLGDAVTVKANFEGLNQFGISTSTLNELIGTKMIVKRIRQSEECGYILRLDNDGCEFHWNVELLELYKETEEEEEEEEEIELFDYDFEYEGKPNDPVNNPSHYTDGGIETIDYLEAKLSREEFIGFLRGNLLKYSSRAGKKDDIVQDFSKAQWYLDRLIKTLKK